MSQDEHKCQVCFSLTTIRSGRTCCDNCMSLLDKAVNGKLSPEDETNDGRRKVEVTVSSGNGITVISTKGSDVMYIYPAMDAIDEISPTTSLNHKTFKISTNATRAHEVLYDINYVTCIMEFFTTAELFGIFLRISQKHQEMVIGDENAKLIENKVLYDIGFRQWEKFINDTKTPLHAKLDTFYGDWCKLQLINLMEPCSDVKRRPGEEVDDTTVSETVSQSDIENDLDYLLNVEEVHFIVDSEHFLFVARWIPKVKLFAILSSL